MRYTISRIDLTSVFKITFVLATLGGLLVALIYSFIFAVISQLGSGLFGPEGSELFHLGSHIGIVAVFFLGIFFAVLNGIFSAVVLTIMAAVYNSFAGWIGGFAVELSPRNGGGALGTAPASGASGGEALAGTPPSAGVPPPQARPPEYPRFDPPPPPTPDRSA